MDKPSFLVIDSGIGGLTVLKHLFPLYASADFFYFSDGKNLPYGDKSEDFLFERTCEVLNEYAAPFDGVIFACNTISTTLFKRIGGEFGKKIFGVFPDEPKGKTLILCTKATGDSALVRGYLGCGLTRVETYTELAAGIERNVGKALSCDYSFCASIFPSDDGYETVTLGCTHYIYLRPLMRTLYPRATITDGREALFRSVCDHLEKIGVKMTTASASAKLPCYRFLGGDLFRNYAVFCKIPINL